MSLFPNVDELRQYVQSDLDDLTLETYAQDADAAIVQRYGPNFEDLTLPLVKFMLGGGPVLLHVPEVVTEFREAAVVLADGIDYRRRYAGVYERLPAGTVWGDNDPDMEVEVRYAPVDDTSSRRRVAVQLVRLSCQYSGYTLLRSGDLQVSAVDESAERRKVLNSLRNLAPVVA